MELGIRRKVIEVAGEAGGSSSSEREDLFMIESSRIRDFHSEQIVIKD